MKSITTSLAIILLTVLALAATSVDAHQEKKKPKKKQQDTTAAVDIKVAEPNRSVELDPDPDELNPGLVEPAVDLDDLRRRVVYPELARQNGIEGKVVVRVLVDKNGRPVKYRIDMSDSRVLEDAATKAVMQCRFTPAIQDGVPVKAWVAIPVMFDLSY